MRGFTVEMSFLMPIILLLIMSSILSVFYFHDKNIISGAAYETAVVGSNKAREKDGADVGELETLFQERVGNKCILFAKVDVVVDVSDGQIEVQAQAARRKMKISVVKRAAVTEPEKVIRDIRRVKELVNGKKDYN